MPVNVLDFWFVESIRDKKFEDHYELGKELGRGATAVVYKCIAKGTNQAWAVKILDKKVEHKTVVTEVGILLKIEHPNIVQMKEVYETLETVYIILELVTEEQAALAVRDIISAVDYLHKHDIVHRDLKPENILYENLSQDSKLKICDFGLSTIVSNKVSLVTLCGTPGYCAPEVLKGNNYGKSCDMWSVGVIAYILLCGYEPFHSDNEPQMFKKILKGDYSFDSPWWDEISNNAKDLVRKLLVVDPAKRLTASAALKHVWVTGMTNKKTHMETTVDKIKEFNARRKLKFTTDVILAVVAATKRLPLKNMLNINLESHKQPADQEVK
ncbi:calcium/calmodulin-dependent protein kinase type IV [Biomphalaria pfeifferi]|uniref:Calcium/calmodulin-dependent protein kinase type IV n=1 Tax=Biomphalaria pfeifferi TaxID=112525 RepID=A0AAD8BMN0_BIOPF|nr:calcium/calmodulin-dependent protein kinase type IV [Biomphalaria pfeifferi]